MKKILCALLGLILTLPGFAACPSGQIEQTYTSATGTVTQNGTPSPDNPIEPTFYQQGNMVLRALKTNYGGIVYKDSYDATTGKITRRVGMRILDGTENWDVTTASVAENSYFYLSFDIPLPEGFSNGAISTHFPTVNVGTANNNQGIIVARRAATGYEGVYVRWNDLYMANSTTLNSFKQWLAEQYANGTPVTVYYPLETPVEEDWAATTYCITPIKIATTAYNSARFSPVVTELNDTIATIRDVVTNTINQTKAIADLQATKQTRPDETCPAGKKCLLVEDNAGQPHWYEIIENAYGLPNGYTALEYLQSDGASYLIVPYRVNNKTVFYCRYNEIRNGPQVANAVFGVTTSPDTSKANNGILRLTGSSFDRMGWGNSVSGSIIDVGAPKVFNTWYEVLYDQNNLYQDGTLYATSATDPSTVWSANYDLGIFARSSASVTMPAIAKISSVWAKENGEYKINLIPARRNSDSVLGMYDTVSGTFFTNKGSGTFTAGPEI